MEAQTQMQKIETTISCIKGLIGNLEQDIKNLQEAYLSELYPE